MKNYFIQLQELKTSEARLETLKERKIRLKNKIKSCTKELSDEMGSSSFTEDKMTKYLIKLEEIDEEISELEQEIHSLNRHLNTMAYALTQIKNIEYEIFLMKYKDNMEVRDIARKKSYSIGRVYQHLDKINKKIGAKSKHYKKL